MADTTQNQMLVRIRPVRKAKAPRVRRYMFENQRYDADRGWYAVSARTAEKMRKLNQDHYDPDSPPVFDVATREEAMKIEENEAKRAERATAVRPNVLNAREQRRAERRGAGGAFTTRDIHRVAAAKHEDAYDPDEDLLDPDGTAALDVDDMNDPGLNQNVGRVRRGALPGTEPVPPDESHDGDKGVHAYQNKAFPAEGTSLGSVNEPLDHTDGDTPAPTNGDDPGAIKKRTRK
jgi:hypothetical protein